jgi:hypothetical protein
VGVFMFAQRPLLADSEVSPKILNVCYLSFTYKVKTPEQRKVVECRLMLKDLRKVPRARSLCQIDDQCDIAQAVVSVGLGLQA